MNSISLRWEIQWPGNVIALLFCLATLNWAGGCMSGDLALFKIGASRSGLDTPTSNPATSEDDKSVSDLVRENLR